ncbi:MAG: hypothetical protein II640_07585 [Lachnospiraceae bacterium]|nr:hypothetical protein [Lachnospiraceae bacterium]
MNTANEVLGFRKEGLRGLHFYIKGLEYPIAAAEYSERDAQAFRFLDKNVKDGTMDSERICEWCINHGIYFTFLYGVRIKHVLSDPLKALRFLQMRGRLKQFSAR